MRFAKPSRNDSYAAAGGLGPTRPDALAAGGETRELSGKAWTSRFPTSRRIEDLAPSFGRQIAAFVAALRDAGASVHISATLRPPERAYLMHWAWRISEEGFPPADVPPLPGVDIEWRHSTLKASQAAARAMAGTYSLVRVADLASRHCEGRAIDMTISWRGKLRIAAPDGSLHTIVGRPRDGTHPGLVEIGRLYGAIKLAADPPHWSDDGQ